MDYALLYKQTQEAQAAGEGHSQTVVPSPPVPVSQQDGSRKAVPSGSQPTVQSKAQGSAPAANQPGQRTPHYYKQSVRPYSTMPVNDPMKFDARIMALEKQISEQKELINKLQNENMKQRETITKLQKNTRVKFLFDIHSHAHK